MKLLSRAGEPVGVECFDPWSLSWLRKKTGAGASNNMPFLYRLLEDKKHKEIVKICTLLFRTGEPEPGVLGSSEPEPLEKKRGAGAAWKKSQEPEPLKN